MTEVGALIDAGLLRRDVPLGPLTTYKAGGPARLFAEIGSAEELVRLIDSGATRDSEVLILGRGSNLVVADAGFEGLAVKLDGDFNSLEVEGDTVIAGGAVPLPRLARQAVESGLLGLEFFVGIPGSVGGAVRQNAGCFGSETRDRLVKARIVSLRSGKTRDSDSGDLALGYRQSNLGTHDLVVSATFRGDVGDSESGKSLIREITRWRRDHQPGGTLNAGSVFKNPPDVAAGELIDQLGLKGMSVGDVAVSEKHANFFVAGPEATSADILELVRLVKDIVLERTGTMLESEIQFVGFGE